MIRTLSMAGRASAAALLLLSGSATGSASDPIARSICPVCIVREGGAQPEAVRATRVHEGTTHSFCSETCASEFEANPSRYLSPSTPDSTAVRETHSIFEGVSSVPT